MQINDIIGSDAEESIKKMLLNSSNCSNPSFWGKDLIYKNRKIIEPQGIRVIPDEFDFFNAWCGKDPINARTYYGLQETKF